MAMKVFIAVDRSEHAAHAFQYYVENIHKEGNDVIVAHVVDPPEPSLMTGVVWEEAMISGIVWQEAVEQQRQRAKLVEEEYVQLMKNCQLHGKVMLLEGFNAGEVLTNTAIKEQANMVIMGSRGLGTLRRTILGSVSDYVVHHAGCPVVICRYDEDEEKKHVM